MLIPCSGPLEMNSCCVSPLDKMKFWKKKQVSDGILIIGSHRESESKIEGCSASPLNCTSRSWDGCPGHGSWYGRGEVKAVPLHTPCTAAGQPRLRTPLRTPDGTTRAVSRSGSVPESGLMVRTCPVPSLQTWLLRGSRSRRRGWKAGAALPAGTRPPVILWHSQS